MPADIVRLPNYALTMPTNQLNIYKASAGSGKTYTLTQEYLRLLLRPNTGARNILAITFTNAATADMKRKIVETLAEIAGGEYKDYQKLAGRNETAEALQKRARAVLRELLHQYQDFSIKTIDSFVQNLIKPFAFELGLPRNYTTNIEEQQLAEDITTKIIEAFGLPDRQEQTDILRNFLSHRNEGGKSLNITDSISKVVKLLFEEKSFGFLEKLGEISGGQFNENINRIKALREKTENEAKAVLSEGSAVISQNNLTASHFHEGQRGLYKWFTKLAESEDIKSTLKEISAPGNSVLKCVEKGILKSGDITAAGALQNCYERLCNLKLSDYFLLEEIHNSIYSLALVNHANEILKEIKEETAAIPISEFNKRIEQALTDENNDFIYERSGARYRHIFIDEFQDTSRLQWKNLKPLFEENLAQGNECLLVGDPKQSIYRFRNADIQQFVNLCQNKGGMAVAVNNLQSNWRSTPGIIAFNNDFYRFINENYTDGFAQAVFEGHEQFFKAETQSLPKEDPQAVRVLIAKNLDNETLNNWYLNETLNIVRKFPVQDVTILCRKKSQCSEVANFLLAHGIPVSTSESLVLSNHIGLCLLVNSLRYINESNAHFNQNKTFYKQMCFILAKELGVWPKHTGTENFYEDWELPETERIFNALHQTCMEQADLYDTVESVLHFWGMESHIDQYILTFLDCVQENRFYGISALLDWWDEYAGQTSVSSSQKQECVQIMTIHKSKGLQFKVVVFPFIWDTKLNYQDLFWISGQQMPNGLNLPAALVRYVNSIAVNEEIADRIEEEKQLTDLDNLNTLYVATTRPQEKLFLLCSAVEKAGRFSSAKAICEFTDAHPEYIEKIEDGNLLPQDTGVLSEATPPDIDFTKKKELKKTSSEAVQKNNAPFVSWRNRMESAYLDTETPTPEILWGNFIHSVLSNIDTAGEHKLQQAIHAGLNEFPQWREQREKAAEFIRNVLEHPVLKPFFSKEYHIKKETGIVSAKGQIHIPDRVAIKGDTAVVLDYKTGSPHKSHHDQVRQYMDLLQEMGLECKQGFIVYLGEELKVEEVS